MSLGGSAEKDPHNSTQDSPNGLPCPLFIVRTGGSVEQNMKAVGHDCGKERKPKNVGPEVFYVMTVHLLLKSLRFLVGIFDRFKFYRGLDVLRGYVLRQIKW